MIVANFHRRLSFSERWMKPEIVRKLSRGSDIWAARPKTPIFILCHPLAHTVGNTSHVGQVTIEIVEVLANHTDILCSILQSQPSSLA